MYSSNLHPNDAGAINSHVQAGVEQYSEIKDYLQQRSAIEKEYARKLVELGKKMGKKACSKKQGANEDQRDDTKKLTRRGTVESSIMESMATEGDLASKEVVFSNDIILRLSQNVLKVGQFHMSLAETYENSIFEEARKKQNFFENIRRKCIEILQRQYSERDRLVSERDKCREKYQALVVEYRNSLAKRDRLVDEKFEKNQNKVMEILAKKNMAKNEYILSNAVLVEANAYMNKKGIHQIMEKLESLDITRVTEMKNLMRRIVESEYDAIEKVKDIIYSGIGVVQKIDGPSEVESFMKSCAARNQPPDMEYRAIVDESSGETTKIEDDDESKIILSNIAYKAQSRLVEIDSVKASKNTQKDLAKASGNSFVELFNDLESDFIMLDIEEAGLNAKIECITQSIGDVSTKRMHKFVKTTFSLPTTCGYCAESIWGLSSKGAKCEDCSYSCHLKCEIKVPADCTGPPDQPKGNFITRAFRGKKSKKDSMSSINKSTNDLSSSTDNFETLKNSNRGSDENISLKSEANSNTEIFSRPLSTQVENKSQFDDEVSAFSYAVNSGRSNEIIEKTRDVSAVVLYDYISQQGNDLTISKGDVLQIISEDDGSGWLKARASNGRVGVVPANYVDINAEDNPTHERFFTALYDFTGRNDNEISFEKGDRIQFTGECADDSWFYGILRGQAGIFPKSYVE